MKPSEFLTNIVDFFAVLLPGAIFIFSLYLIFLPEPNFRFDVVFTKQIPLTTQGWIVFIVTSYIIGSFIFVIGSLLDGKFYGWVQKIFYNNSWRKNVLNKKTTDVMWKYGENCLEEILGKDAVQITDVVKWAKANVYLFYSGAAAEIHRFEANSKLFRSLSTVMFFLFLIALIKSLWIFALICIFSVPMLLFSYADQRFKYSELACIYLIAIHRKGVFEKPKE